MSFDKISSLLAIRGEIIAETGLHIGTASAALDPSATDSPVSRDGSGRPFIPGASFKGALRAHLESIVRGWRRKSVRACDPLIDPCIPRGTENDGRGIEDLKKAAEREATDTDEAGKATLNRVKYDQLLTSKILGQSCTVCRLFGSPWLAARLMVKDLAIVPESFAGRVELRDGVGIDRDTETARQGIKYDFEVAPASSRFEVEMVVENASNDLIGLLAVGLREMEQQRIALGGKTTRGLGCVTLEIAEIEVIGDAVAQDHEGTGSVDLLDYLVARKGRSITGTALHDYLDGKIGALAANHNGRSEPHAQETT